MPNVNVMSDGILLRNRNTDENGVLSIKTCEKIENNNFTFTRDDFCENTKQVSTDGVLDIEVVVLPKELSKYLKFCF